MNAQEKLDALKKFMKKYDRYLKKREREFHDPSDGFDLATKAEGHLVAIRELNEIFVKRVRKIIS